jgi:HEAT repeat protein
MSSPEQDERQKQGKRDAAPIVTALRDAGFAVDSIADLFNRKLSYKSAIPLLIEWLPRTANRDVKQDLVRALSVKWAKAAAPILVSEFESASGDDSLGLRWAIGNALDVLANDEISDAMLKLATTKEYGRAREMVVLGLGKLTDSRVPDTLIQLLEDDDVAGHAAKALGKLRVKRARTALEAVQNHPNQWIRKEVRKALESIQKP